MRAGDEAMNYIARAAWETGESMKIRSLKCGLHLEGGKQERRIRRTMKGLKELPDLIPTFNGLKPLKKQLLVKWQRIK